MRRSSALCKSTGKKPKGSTVRAIVVRCLGEPEVLRLEEVPLPAHGAGELLVRLLAVGVNPADTYVRAGFAGRHDLPYTPGDDAAGIVEAVGAGVDEPAVGESVYLHGSLTGTYAEYALCLPEHVHPLPDGLSLAQGAAIGVPYGTAYRALFQRAGAQPGETVLVHGATGAVGLATVQLAAAAGLYVVGTGGSEEGRRLALANGAANALDHTLGDHLEQALALIGDRGFDVIIEMRSDLNLGGDLRVLAQSGRVVCIGNRGPSNQGEVLVNARDLMRRDGAVLGMFLPNASKEDMASIHRALAEGLEQGLLHPIVARELPLQEAAVAHRTLMTGHSLGKLVLVP
jgi:NADPH2:quinone reductase